MIAKTVAKYFKVKRKLTMHIKSVHNGIKYKCDHCDNEFADFVSRYLHIKSIHEQKKYPCTLCDYQATTQSSLISHQSIHVQYVHIKHHVKVILINMFSQNIKEGNISVILVIKNIHIHHISGIIINQFMKV